MKYKIHIKIHSRKNYSASSQFLILFNFTNLICSHTWFGFVDINLTSCISFYHVISTMSPLTWGLRVKIGQKSSMKLLDLRVLMLVKKSFTYACDSCFSGRSCFHFEIRWFWFVTKLRLLSKSDNLIYSETPFLPLLQEMFCLVI